MNDLQIEKIKRFANDAVLNDAIYQLLIESFTKIRPRSELGATDELAARFIAIQLIQEAWKEIEKYKLMDSSQENKVVNNVGL